MNALTQALAERVAKLEKQNAELVAALIKAKTSAEFCNFPANALLEIESAIANAKGE